MDSLSLIGNILFISFLGLLVAFNPMLIVVDVLLVLKSKRPILNTAFLTAGFACSVIFLFLLASALVDPNSQISLRQLNDNLDIPPLIDLFAGLLLLSYAAGRYRNPKTSSVPEPLNLNIPQKPLRLFLFGFIKASLSVTNIFAIAILAKLSITNDWDTTTGFIAVIWLLIIGIAPLAIIAYYRMFRHQSLAVIDHQINKLLARNIYRLITYGLAGVGVVFTINGVLGLLFR